MSASVIDTPTGGAPAGAVPPTPGRAERPWVTMWRVEMTKLAAQLRVRIALGACLLGPIAFAVAMAVQTGVPSDTLFGRYVHESGLAVPLVVLSFSGQWVLPILVSIVAGDVCASEDRHHTWTLLLSRSRTRSDVLAGKVLSVTCYAVAVVVVLALSAVLTGIVAVGTQDLVGLSGTTLPFGNALRAVVESWATALPPTLAVTALAVAASVLSRNSWVGVVVPVLAVLLLNLLSLLSALDPVRPFLPTSGFDAWHGLVRDVTYTSPIVDSLLVSAAWIAASLAVAAIALVRRDVEDA